MTIEEAKREITQRTGVPAMFLAGETIEENIAQAKAFLAFTKKYQAKRPKSTAEQFAEWYNQQEGIEEQDEAGAALTDIENRARLEAGEYPRTTDGGEVGLGDTRTTKEKFAEWFEQKAAFNPFKDADGWTRID